jgi:uncharacterized protein (TIGR02391 family)
VIELSRAIPDPKVLIALEPEELGAKILFLLRHRSFSRGMFMPHALNGELFEALSLPGQQPPYPTALRGEIDLALAEAWAWLEAQGLIIPSPDGNGPNGWRVLSRRAQRFENETEFARYAMARMLPKDILHSRIAENVWLAFMRGEYDVAVFQAMKAVEVSVRQGAALGNDVIGVNLMRQAFAPNRGPLTDTSAEGGEQTARMELFAGTIGSYKNPHSHRDVDLNDPVEAVEIIMLANHLLRITEVRTQARSSQPSTALSQDIMLDDRGNSK